MNASQIARDLTLDPRTVAYWLTQEHFRPRTPRPRSSKLDPFKPEIGRMLDRYPYSAAQVFQRLREHGFDGGYSLAFAPGECAQVEPRRPRAGRGPGDLQWHLPSESIIGSIITNPAYAGAFVYGRRTSAPQRHAPGRRTPATVRRPMEEWQCILHDAYPAYISWPQFVANQERLGENAWRYSEKTGQGRGAPREGAALLQGLLTCGRCGYRMSVAYRPRARYTCEAMARRFAQPRCVSLEGPPIEAFVVQAFFDALAPAQLETLDDVLAQRQRDQQRRARYHHQQVTQARFSANGARRRYEQVDPAYRLAAAELERDWDDKLRALRQAEEAAARFTQEPAEPTLSPELREQLLHLSQSLPAWWVSDQLGHYQRKALLRSLISQVVVQRPAADRVEVTIIWVSGHFSAGIVIPPVLHQHHVPGYDTRVERIQQWWSKGDTDAQIAATLSREGFRSARRDRVVARTVLRIRNTHHWVSRYHQHRLADKIDAMWTIHGLSRHLGTAREWFYQRIRTGALREPDVMRKPPDGNYLIRDDAALLDRLRAEVQRSRRVGRGAATGSILPERGASLGQPVAVESSVENRARTSRTNHIS